MHLEDVREQNQEGLNAETDLFELHLLSCCGSPQHESRPTTAGNVKLQEYITAKPNVSFKTQKIFSE